MATDTWTGGAASWTTPGDWSAGVPTMTSDVVVAQTGGPFANPTATSAVSIASLSVSGGEVDFNSAGASAVTGSVTVSGNGGLHFDYNDSGGGTSLAIGGALTLSAGSFAIGANTQSTGDTVTAASLSVANGAGLGIQNETTHTETDTLDITGAAGFGTVSTLTGNVLLASGNGVSSAVIEFGTGSITTIAAGGSRTLNGPKAFIADASNTAANSALTQLATINGTLNLNAIGSLTLTNALTNTGSISVADQQSVGGTSLTVSGVLTNSGQFTVGSIGQSYADTITATGLTNYVGNTLGSILVYGGTAAINAPSATLDITGMAGFGTVGVLTGAVSIDTDGQHGAAILEFATGEITTIAANSSLAITDPNSFLADATNTSANSALTGLTTNNGSLSLNDIAPLTLTGAFTNNGTLDFSNATLNISGTLINSNTVSIGSNPNGSINGPLATTVTATGLSNTSSGSITLSGGSSSLGQLTVNGTAVNNGTVTIDVDSTITVTGNPYTQAGGTTTVNGGTLTASAIDVSGGTLVLGTTGSLSTGVTFTSGSGTLKLDSKTNLPSSIVGAISGDEIDFNFQSYASGDQAVWQQNGSTGTLTLETSGGTSLAAVTLTGAYASADFSPLNDNAGGTAIQLVTAPSSPPPVTPPAATTAAMIMRDDNNGDFEIYDFGNNAILAAGPLGQVGLEWQVAGVGAFNAPDTSDMILRNTGTGQFEIYDVSNNTITNAAGMGQVGLEWTVSGFGDFSSRAAETDMLMRNGSGQFEVYDLANNGITFAAPMGQVGLEWSVAGFGDFSTRPNESDMLMRNNNTGAFEIYDISNNQVTSAGPMGQVGLEWSVVGFGDFSSNANESDMLMRNNNTGAFEIYDISNSQVTSAGPMGQVGLEWSVVGFGPINGVGTSDMMMRNSNTGVFEVYDIANNQLTNAAPAGQVGNEWQSVGLAADPPASANAQLTQAMASYAASAGTPGASSPLDQTAVAPSIANNMLALSNV